MAVITVTRNAGSYGDQISKDVASRLNCEWIDHHLVMEKFIAPIADEQTLRMLQSSPKFFLSETKEGLSFKEYLSGALLEMAERQDAVLVGFAGVLFFQHDPTALHVRLYADRELRVQRTAKIMTCTIPQATQFIQRKDRQMRRFASTLFGAQEEKEHYHININTGKVTQNEAVETIVTLFNEMKKTRALEAKNIPGSELHTEAYPLLKNKSEIEFAKLLDHYELEWRYEPRTFPVEWDAEGRVTLAFSPDFYLPRFDLYLELTTMNQKYVTLKNKKLAKLKTLYPGVNVRIVYKRDFLSMMERFEDDL